MKENIEKENNIEYNNYLMKNLVLQLQALKQLKRKQALSSRIYKVALYNFKASKKPYYLVDGDFNNVFEFTHGIYAIVLNSNCLMEIATGTIYPIIDLEKKDSRWKSSYIKCLKDDGEVPLEFGISENKILKVKKFNLNELYKYLSYDKKIIAQYLSYDKEAIAQCIKEQEDKVKKLGTK